MEMRAAVKSADDSLDTEAFPLIQTGRPIDQEADANLCVPAALLERFLDVSTALLIRRVVIRRCSFAYRDPIRISEACFWPVGGPEKRGLGGERNESLSASAFGSLSADSTERATDRRDQQEGYCAAWTTGERQFRRAMASLDSGEALGIAGTTSGSGEPSARTSRSSQAYRRCVGLAGRGDITYRPP